VFHEFYVLDKVSNGNVSYDRKYIRCKKIASITSQKAAMQALSIFDCTDCSAEPHLLSVLVKVKKILTKRLSHACMETHVSFVEANMVYGHKTTTYLKETYTY